MKVIDLRRYLELMEDDAEVLIKRFVKGSQVGDYIEECTVSSCEIFGSSILALWEDSNSSVGGGF